MLESPDHRTVTFIRKQEKCSQNEFSRRIESGQSEPSRETLLNLKQDNSEFASHLATRIASRLADRKVPGS